MKIAGLLVCLLVLVLDRQETTVCHATLYFCEQPSMTGPLLPGIRNTLQMRQQDI